jgi:hypothetical protein
MRYDESLVDSGMVVEWVPKRLMRPLALMRLIMYAVEPLVVSNIVHTIFFMNLLGLERTPSVLKKLTFRTATRSPKHNFDLLLL